MKYLENSTQHTSISRHLLFIITHPGVAPQAQAQAQAHGIGGAFSTIKLWLVVGQGNIALLQPFQVPVLHGSTSFLGARSPSRHSTCSFKWHFNASISLSLTTIFMSYVTSPALEILLHQSRCKRLGPWSSSIVVL